jgi:hypothetical protein
VYKTLSAQIGATVCDRSNLERENRRGSWKMAYYRQALWHSSMSSCPARSIRFELQKKPSLRFYFSVLARKEEGMNFARRQTLELFATIVIAPFLSQLGSAQTYPARPVRVIVPYAPGGITDVFARLIAQRLSDDLGKQFYVDNIPGGSGNIGTGQAARSTPDGYTILVVFSSYVVNPTLFDKIPYDPNKDFSITCAPWAGSAGSPPSMRIVVSRSSGGLILNWSSSRAY